MRIACIAALRGNNPTASMFLRYTQRNIRLVTVYVLDSLNQQALARVQAAKPILALRRNGKGPPELQQQSLLA